MRSDRNRSARNRSDRSISDRFSSSLAEAFEELSKALSVETKQLRPAKMSALVKKKADDTQKVRLIVDMRRNGSNGQVSVRECLVLPQLADAAECVVDHMHARGCVRAGPPCTWSCGLL
eukprot:937243-Amphidinium_carterae.2